MKMNKKGFTLIELMIVVAIIGILAVVAVPKFADLINKSKEGATKAGLSGVRGALQVYYSDNEGVYPSSLTDGAFTPKYINELPLAKLPGTGHTGPGVETQVTEFPNPTDAVTDSGGWGYYTHSVTNHSTYGWFGVACTHEPLTAPGKTWSQL